MIFLHYIIPFIIYYITDYKKRKNQKKSENKIFRMFFKYNYMLLGLLLANLIDLDHVFYRLIGKVGWFESACKFNFDHCSSFGIYPLHNWIFFAIFALSSSALLIKNKNLKIIGWIAIGACIHIILDLIVYYTGVFI